MLFNYSYGHNKCTVSFSSNINPHQYPRIPSTITANPQSSVQGKATQHRACLLSSKHSRPLSLQFKARILNRYHLSSPGMNVQRDSLNLLLVYTSTAKFTIAKGRNVGGIICRSTGVCLSTRCTFSIHQNKNIKQTLHLWP